MTLAPICIFSYNRPNHLRRVLDALSKNDLASESVLFIFCDGAKPLQTDADKDSDEVTTSAKRFFKGTETEYEKYISDIEDNIKAAQSATGFKDVHIIIRPQNIGLKDNIVSAVTEVVNKYGRIITLEDDIITSKGFLRYMNDALEVYKDEEKVMYVCGYMFPVKHEKYLPDTFFHPVPYPGGGWATWARAWKYYDDDISSHYLYWRNNWKLFNVWGPDLQKQLTMNYESKLRTWFIRWYASMHKLEGLALYPHHSLTTNIGFDGTGSNCVALIKNKYWVDSIEDYVPVSRIKKLRPNKLAVYDMYVFWSGHWYSKRHRTVWIHKIRSMISIK